MGTDRVWLMLTNAYKSSSGRRQSSASWTSSVSSESDSKLSSNEINEMKQNQRNQLKQSEIDWYEENGRKQIKGQNEIKK
jgi:hypothetical protein